MSVSKRIAVSLLCLTMLLVALPSARAQDSEVTTESEHFTLTWPSHPGDSDAPDLTDADDDGTPDSVELALATFERAHTFLVEQLRFQAPPGEGRYEVYLGQGAYTRIAPGGEGRSRESFIVIPPADLHPGLEAYLNAVVVHEYFHAIQFGYDSQEDRWMAEASSAWAEGVFTPEEEHNAGYAAFQILNPRMPLDSTDQGHQYSAFLFLQFLTERYGGGELAGAGLIRALWERMAAPEGFPGATDMDSDAAIRSILDERGIDFEDAWAEFLIWMRRLSHFEHGDAYASFLNGRRAPLLHKNAIRTESCRLIAGRNEDDVLEGASGDYVRLKPRRKGPVSAIAELTVTGPPGVVTAAAMVRSADRSVDEIVLDFDDEGIARLQLPFGTDDVRNVTLALGNASLEGAETQLAYSLRVLGRGDVTATSPSGSNSVIYGTAGVLTGDVSCTGSPASHAQVEVTATDRSTGAVSRLRAVTGPSGSWSLLTTPEANSTYSVAVDDPLLSGAVGDDPHRIDVIVAVTIGIAPERAALGEPVTVSGDVLPAHPGAEVALEYRRPERRWHLGGSTAVAPDGSYNGSIVVPRDGIWLVRARVTDTHDDDHLPGDSLGRVLRVVAP